MFSKSQNSARLDVSTPEGMALLPYGIRNTDAILTGVSRRVEFYSSWAQAWPCVCNDLTLVDYIPWTQYHRIPNHIDVWQPKASRRFLEKYCGSSVTRVASHRRRSR